MEIRLRNSHTVVWISIAIFCMVTSALGNLQPPVSSAGFEEHLVGIAEDVPSGRDTTLHLTDRDRDPTAVDDLRNKRESGSRKLKQVDEELDHQFFEHPERFEFVGNTKDLEGSSNLTFIAIGQGGQADALEEKFDDGDNQSSRPRDLRQFEYGMLPHQQQNILSECFQRGELGWLNRQKRIETLAIQSAGADPKSTMGTAYAFSAPNPQAIALSNTSVLLEFASLAFLDGMTNPDTYSSGVRQKRQSQNFLETNSISNVFANSVMERIDVRPFVRETTDSNGGAGCQQKDDTLPCDPFSPYRSYSGWCNNLRNPSWGKSVTTFDRMIPSVYADGISLPKSKSVTGRPLPSPRYVSQMVHIDVSHLSQRNTLMFMQFGQFLDHDITFTPVNKGAGEAILNCRDCDSGRDVHPECWPIPVPTGDGWYPNQNTDTGKPYCIPFTRSLPGQQRLGPREQINQNSAYLDASQVYGENVCKMASLRGGLGTLNSTRHPRAGGKSLMPQVPGMRECKSPSGFCFHAGDPRSSEQPALAALHTVYLREHNRLADDLRRVNAHWSDEKVYQQARRILSAQNQHIIYSEYLPKLLGTTLMNAYGLSLQNEGYYLSYDPNCKAGIYNEFATSAFRYGHSLIRSHLPRMDNKYQGMQPNLPLRDGFFNSDMLYQPLMVDEIIRGLMSEPMEQLDPFVTNEIRNHLFEDKKKSFSGLDLISLNLHRGRDHGLPGYNAYRAACNLKKVTNFQELASEIPTDVIARLQKAYLHVDDIDLFTGSLVERNVVGGVLGPTMACMIGTQFKRLRQCDRFWYETNDPIIQFSPQQLAEIRKATLSKLICSNLDMSSDIQKDAFDAAHKILNPRIPCDRLPTLNLEPWREKPLRPNRGPVGGCHIGGRQIVAGQTALLSPCVSCICTSEGTKCASMKITSCHNLIKEAVREDIYRDEVCMAQCGYLLQQVQPKPPNISKLSYNSKAFLNIVNGRNRLAGVRRR